jgi:hypothetical protein
MKNKKLKIKDWLNCDLYKKFKIEICKQNIFETCLYDKEGNPFGQYGTTHSTTLFTHLALLRYLFSLKEIFPNKPNFIDLGSGSGNVVIYAANQGWKSYGIEFCKGCYDASLVNIRSAIKANYIKREDVKIYFNNIFPLEFKLEKYPGDKIEDDFRNNLNKFSKNSINLKPEIYKKADLFYHYQVERRQNILNLFSKYAKKDSLLVFVATREDSFTLPSNISKIDSELDMTIYQKMI